MENGIFEQVDRAVLKPIDSRRINFGSTSQETADLVRRSSLSFAATNLLSLNPEQITLLSKRIRLLFTRIASQNKLKIDKKDLEQFRESDENSLAHELDHLRKVQEFRPEVIAQTSINILPLLHADMLKVAMNVMVPVPDVEYTILEKTLIQMAPNLPSGQDYFDLSRYMENHTSAKEDLERVRKIVDGKKPSHGKDHFLAFLDKLSSPSS